MDVEPWLPTGKVPRVESGLVSSVQAWVVVKWELVERPVVSGAGLHQSAVSETAVELSSSFYHVTPEIIKADIVL